MPYAHLFTRRPALMRTWKGLAQAPVASLQGFGRLVLLAVAGLTLLMAQAGTLRTAVNWMDIASEGGTVMLLGLWLVQLRIARPAGRVTSVLALGLSALLLGQSMDLLDELWQLPKAALWDNLIESGFNLAGVIGLTWGLHLWRQEQVAFSRTLRGRERLFREHRHLDALTALGDADYMGAQIDAERRSAQAGALVMLGWRDFPGLVLREGPQVVERLQHSAAQWLLLALRPGDLLCHYAGDRFIVLLPSTGPQAAAETAQVLHRALAAYSCALPDGRRLQPAAQMALAPLHADRPAAAQMLALHDQLSTA